MKAVLHIGTEKTGTSYIQEFLYTNRKSLASLGFGLLQSPEKKQQKLGHICHEYGQVRRSCKTTWTARDK